MVNKAKVVHKPEYKMNDLYLTLALTVLVVIIAYLLTKKFKKSVNVVLFTGLSDSGKTALFTKIIYNRLKPTVTSLKENDASVKEFNSRLIDLPGTDRLRSRYWEQYRSKASHVVFIVDSTTVEDKIRELSEYLYTLLSDGILYRNKIQFTIACNKQDIENAQSCNEIKPMIESELNAIRSTKTGQLGTTSNEQGEDYLTNLDVKQLSLDKLKIKVIETSTKDPSQLIKLIQ